jgi:hypothetical protein
MRTVHPSAHLGPKGISFTSFTGLEVVPVLFAPGGCSSAACNIPESSYLEGHWEVDSPERGRLPSWYDSKERSPIGRRRSQSRPMASSVVE